MAKYPADYAWRVNKVTISGDCFGGIEEWTTGFYLGATDGNAADPGTGTASAVAGHWNTYFTGTNSKTSTAYRTTQVKVSQLELDGDVDLGMIDIYDYATPAVGTNGGAPLPPQITLAATLTSDNQRGLASKGRMYLPGVNLPIFTNDPRISTTEHGHIANGLKTFFDAINADAAIDGYAILASKGHKVKEAPPSTLFHYLEGINARVTGLRVGNVYYKKRRRLVDVTEVDTTRFIS